MPTSEKIFTKFLFAFASYKYDIKSINYYGIVLLSYNIGIRKYLAKSILFILLHDER
jgi:hypothetical protein